MLDTVVISGEDACCSVVGVSVLRVMWSELLMASAIILHGHQCTSARKWTVRSHL